MSAVMLTTRRLMRKRMSRRLRRMLGTAIIGITHADILLLADTLSEMIFGVANVYGGVSENRGP